MNKNDKIYVAGHRGLVGSAILRRLEAGGYGNIVVKTHARLDLTRQAEVEAFFEAERPDYVFLGAAKVGGIGANSAFPAQFIYVNLAIGLNLIHAAHRYKVKKLLNLGSSCIYPRLAPQPLKEEYFMTGPLESTNEAYALAKIAAIRLCRHYNEQYGTNFLSVMPTNMYGLGDNYDPEGSHVLPGMIRKFHEAKLARAGGDALGRRESLPRVPARRRLRRRPPLPHGEIRRERSGRVRETLGTGRAQSARARGQGRQGGGSSRAASRGIHRSPMERLGSFSIFETRSPGLEAADRAREGLEDGLRRLSAKCRPLIRSLKRGENLKKERKDPEGKSRKGRGVVLRKGYPYGKCALRKSFVKRNGLMSVNSVNGRGLESRFREKADNFHGSVKNIRNIHGRDRGRESPGGGAWIRKEARR